MEPQNIGIYDILGISVSHCISDENKKEKIVMIKM